MLVLADEPTVDARRQGAGRAYRGQVPGEPGPVRTVERHTCLALEASGQRETRKPHRPGIQDTHTQIQGRILDSLSAFELARVRIRVVITHKTSPSTILHRTFGPPSTASLP